MKRLVTVLLLLCLVGLVPGVVRADNLARDYIPAPPGTFATILYYMYTNGDNIYANGNKVADADLQGHVGLFRPVYWMNAGPFVIDPQFILPFGYLTLDSNDLNLDLSAGGIGDPAVFATIWFLNDTKSKTWVGFTPFFFLPLGTYSNDGALSLGENRWRFREELALVKGFEIIPQHNAYFEVQVGLDILSANDDFGPNSATMRQEPIFNLESHLSYDLTKSLWVSADYYYHYGGHTTVDDLRQGDTMSNSILGATVAWNVLPSTQLLLQYKGDVHTESGVGTQVVTFRLLYATDFCTLTSKVMGSK